MGVELEYRFNILGEIIIQLILVSGFVVLWFAVYKQENTIGDYSIQKIVVYYLMTPVLSLFADVHISRSLGNHIKDGFLSTELVKPQRLWLSYLLTDLGRKVYNLTIVITVYSAILIVLNLFVLKVHFTAGQILFAACFAIFSLVLAISMDFAIAHLAFFVDDVWAFKHFKYILDSILGGRAFPFGLLSSSLRAIFQLLPFQFFFYIPLSYLIGERGRMNFFDDLLRLILWTFAFALIAAFLWKKGIQKYGAYGN